MDIPRYTEMEERLLRENRDLREKVKSQEREILDGITHTGVWIKKLEEKSRYVCELLEKYEPEQYGQNVRVSAPLTGGIGSQQGREGTAMNAGTNDGSGVAAPRLVRFFVSWVMACCGSVRWSRSDPQADCAGCEQSRKSDCIQDCELPEHPHSAGDQVAKHPQEHREDESGCLNIPQWVHEALENIDKRGYMPHELIHIAHSKLILQVCSQMRLIGTTQQNLRSAPQYVLTFLGKSAESHDSHPSCGQLPNRQERSILQGPQNHLQSAIHTMRKLVSGLACLNFLANRRW